MANFYDGVVNFVNKLANRRDPRNQNTIISRKLSPSEMRHIYRSGIGNKIVRLKSGQALNDTLQFGGSGDEEFYKARLDKHVKQVGKWMLAFGRGIVVLHHPGDDLSKPLGRVDPAKMLINTFSGDMISVGDVVLDLQNPRYLRPNAYLVRGHTIHHSRVVDFRYVLPPELDAPNYYYGGISEYELIHEQLVADGIVQRSSPRIIEKASTLFYKVTGFKDAMRSGQESEMIAYYSTLEDARQTGVGAGIIDGEDELEVVAQTISNLAEADQITLRRLAMVTGISRTGLIGESPNGLNASGDAERQVDQDMVESLQSDYLLESINELMRKCGRDVVEFRENQGDTPSTRVAYDVQAVAVAEKLDMMGEDARGYLIDRGVIQEDEFDLFAPPPGVDLPVPDGDEEGAATPADDLAIDPQSALNGAQVTALMEVIERIKRGDITKDTGIKIIATSFPLSVEEARSLVQDVREGAPDDGEAQP